MKNVNNEEKLRRLKHLDAGLLDTFQLSATLLGLGS